MSAPWRDLRDAFVLARTELRATWRRIAANRRQLALTLFGALQFGVVFPLFLFGPATDLGERLAAGDPPLGTLGAVATAVLVTGVYMGSASAFNQNRVGAIGPLIRTSVPPGAVAIGRITSELAQMSVIFVVPIVVSLLLVGVGAGGPVAPVLLAITVFSVLLGSTLVGRAAGAAVRYLGFLSRLSAWTKVLAFLVLMVALFYGTQVLMQSVLGTDAGIGAQVTIPPLLPGEPMQAFAGVLTSPLGGPITPIGVVVTIGVFLSLPLGLAAVVRAETAVLIHVEGEGGAESEETGRSRGVPTAFAGWSTTRVAWRHLLRTARDPKSLGHLLPLLFGGLGGGIYWVTEPDFLVTIGPGAAVVVGSLIAGMTYCLNPLGDDRDQLPLLLTSLHSTEVLLRGRAAAGGILGLVVAVGIGTPLAVVGWSPLYALGQTLLAPVLLAAGAGAALGVGGYFPVFERREYMNVERAHPSQVALVGFLFGWGIVAGGGVFLLFLTVDGVISLPVAVGAWTGYLVLLAVLGYGGYRYASRRFDALTLDEV